ncbi:MAG: A/G-specific adenine glycosylase [Myxococcota bacterium]
MAFPREALLEWYDAHKRDLPWRRTRDPYAIWVSEIMCQQTRVDTVIPYYERFLDRFPTATKLAEASEDDVLSRWSGLGYYRRARLLHAGAKAVRDRHGGAVPEDAEARRALPGVGAYTAGAIGSIAFDKEEALVDGNVARVLSRFARIDAPVGSTASNKKLWALADDAVQGPRPGDFNQALMELGATLCTKAAPACSRCPIAEACQALRQGEVDRLPVPKKKKPPKPVFMVAVVPTVSGRMWLTRSDKSLFGGLWGVPLVEGTPPQGELFKSKAASKGADVRPSELARRALVGEGIRARTPERMGQIEHVLSHRRMTVDVWRAKGARGTEDETLRRFTPAELDEVGIAKLTRKILACATVLPND